MKSSKNLVIKSKWLIRENNITQKTHITFGSMGFFYYLCIRQKGRYEDVDRVDSNLRQIQLYRGNANEMLKL